MSELEKRYYKNIDVLGTIDWVHDYIQELEKQITWISVKDKLPDKNGVYFCYYRGHMNKLYFHNNVWYTQKCAINRNIPRYIIKSVSHWRQMPDQPEGK